MREKFATLFIGKGKGLLIEEEELEDDDELEEEDDELEEDASKEEDEELEYEELEDEEDKIAEALVIALIIGGTDELVVVRGFVED